MERAQSASLGAETVPAKLAHEPALDGLRGVAVLAVVLYHLSVSPFAGPTRGWLPGGFLGVDLFFVLSGFLITTLLLIDHVHRGSAISGRFWARRARRLLPALLVLLVIAAAYAVFVAKPWQLESIRRMGLASLLYVSNWYTIFGHPTTTPLSHTWSLSIEEQWYIVWPFLLAALIVLVRARRQALLVAILGLSAASFVAMAVLFEGDGWSRAYHGTETRASELLVGAALALLLLGRSRSRARSAGWAIDIVGVGGLGLLTWLALTATPFDPWMYRFGFLVIALAGAALVTAATHPASRVVRPVLAWRPLAAVGLISYGLYLYHVPVIKWLSPPQVGLDGWGLVALRVAVMFALAVGSYFLVEMPVRRGAISSRHAIAVVPAALGSVVVLLLLGTGGGYPIPAEAARVEYYQRAAAGTPDDVTRVLVAGEGDVYDLASSGVYQGKGIRGLAVSLLFCGLVDGRVVAGSLVGEEQRCPRWPRTFANGVESYAPEVTVLMTGRQLVFDRVVDGRLLVVGSAELEQHVLASMERAHDVLTADGAPMVLLGVPCIDPPASEAPPIAAVRRDPERVAWVNGMWRAFADSHPSTVVFADAGEVLCPNGDAHPTLGGKPLRGADGRLTPTGVRALWDWLAPVAGAATERTA